MNDLALAQRRQAFTRAADLIERAGWRKRNDEGYGYTVEDALKVATGYFHKPYSTSAKVYFDAADTFRAAVGTSLCAWNDAHSQEEAIAKLRELAND